MKTFKGKSSRLSIFLTLVDITTKLMLSLSKLESWSIRKIFNSSYTRIQGIGDEIEKLQTSLWCLFFA